MNVLSLNLGSSSLKYAVHADAQGTLQCKLARELPTSSQAGEAARTARQAIADAVRELGSIEAVGYRIVFGGPHEAPVRVTDELVELLESLQSFDPLHAPGALAVMREAEKILPDAAHVACFDTAFFRDLPATARALPIASSDPILRRYGFHGLSYEYVVRTLGEKLEKHCIIAHLGNGASIAALLDGRPVYSTMAFSPLSGIIMSTRPGDLDPGVLLFLLEREQISVRQLREMLENGSGLRALSGGEADIQKLCERSDERAEFTIDMFVRCASRAIGALAIELGGIDMLVFTGGIGAHNERVRCDIVRRVASLNQDLAVQVVETDENLIIAHHTAQLAFKQTV